MGAGGSSPPDDSVAHEAVAERLSVLLAAIPDGELRIRAAQRELQALAPRDCTAVLCILVRRAAEREPKVADALGAISRSIDPTHCSPARRAELYRAAMEIGASEIAALFVDLPAQRVFEEADRFDDPHLSQMTLGHRKSTARSRDPELLVKLGLLGEPQVLRNLLENPRVTEALVVRLASRRPMQAAALAEVSRSRRFSSSRSIRRALVLNPYTPGDVAMRLVPLLLAPDWREIAADPTVDPEIRNEARRLLSARGGKDQERAESMADPDEEQRLLREHRRERAEAQARAEEEERRRQEEEANEELSALLEVLEATVQPELTAGLVSTDSLLEVADPSANGFAERRKLSGSENQEDDEKDD